MDKKTLKEKLKAGALTFDDLKQVSGGWHRWELSPEDRAEFDRLVQAFANAPDGAPSDEAFAALSAFEEEMSAKYD